MGKAVAAIVAEIEAVAAVLAVTAEARSALRHGRSVPAWLRAHSLHADASSPSASSSPP